MAGKRRRKKRKKKTIAQMQEELSQPPKIRTGVIHTKIVPDKTKYTRKEKHKKKGEADE